ncbi:uncharacterized protein LTR77_000093 [Saxophila tyrrhenica]|uniref:Major facilitator superfamily (MFS) profile domain-containing protein n=1 Tax=Saxophila tyrrhenica TaxID=1690608 RepID=A0AAV9PQ70_9PEZI|nr:hypothetical protein LTR77_000093 [Saxophila tyrrhenica]
MDGFSRFRPAFTRSTTADTTTSIELVQNNDTKTATVLETPATYDDQDKPQVIDQGLQRGVQNVELVTQTWSRASLIAVFVNIWLLYFVNYFSSSILYNLVPFVTSSYSSHSLLNVIYIVSNAMTAAMYIPLAKTLDVWGRAEGFAIMVAAATIGLILMATCNGLSMFCAAYVFWNIGTGGMTYCVDVVTADISTLRNRGIAYAFTSSPYIITAFAGAKASEQFYNDISWRWAFG